MSSFETTNYENTDQLLSGIIPGIERGSISKDYIPKLVNTFSIMLSEWDSGYY